MTRRKLHITTAVRHVKCAQCFRWWTHFMGSDLAVIARYCPNCVAGLPVMGVAPIRLLARRTS